MILLQDAGTDQHEAPSLIADRLQERLAAFEPGLEAKVTRSVGFFLFDAAGLRSLYRLHSRSFTSGTRTRTLWEDGRWRQRIGQPPTCTNARLGMGASFGLLPVGHCKPMLKTVQSTLRYFLFYRLG